MSKSNDTPRWMKAESRRLQAADPELPYAEALRRVRRREGVETPEVAGAARGSVETISGADLTAMMEAGNISVTVLADEVGVSPFTVYAWRRSRVSPAMTAAVVDALWALYGTDLVARTRLDAVDVNEVLRSKYVLVKDKVLGAAVGVGASGIARWRSKGMTIRERTLLANFIVADTRWEARYFQSWMPETVAFSRLAPMHVIATVLDRAIDGCDWERLEIAAEDPSTPTRYLLALSEFTGDGEPRDDEVRDDAAIALRTKVAVRERDWSRKHADPIGLTKWLPLRCTSPVGHSRVSARDLCPACGPLASLDETHGLNRLGLREWEHGNRSGADHV